MNQHSLCRAFIAALQEVLATMASLECELDRAEPADRLDELEKYCAELTFTGDHAGSLLISVNEHLARIITAAMLGMEADEVEHQDLVDVVGELANMVVGGAKTSVCQPGESMDLGIPTIVEGLDTYQPKQSLPGSEIRAHVGSDALTLGVWMDGMA